MTSVPVYSRIIIITSSGGPKSLTPELVTQPKHAPKPKKLKARTTEQLLMQTVDRASWSAPAAAAAPAPAPAPADAAGRWLTAKAWRASLAARSSRTNPHKHPILTEIYNPLMTN